MFGPRKFHSCCFLVDKSGYLASFLSCRWLVFFFLFFFFPAHPQAHTRHTHGTDRYKKQEMLKGSSAGGAGVAEKPADDDVVVVMEDKAEGEEKKKTASHDDDDTEDDDELQELLRDESFDMLDQQQNQQQQEPEAHVRADSNSTHASQQQQQQQQQRASSSSPVFAAKSLRASQRSTRRLGIKSAHRRPLHDRQANFTPPRPLSQTSSKPADKLHESTTEPEPEPEPVQTTTPATTLATTSSAFTKACFNDDHDDHDDHDDSDDSDDDDLFLRSVLSESEHRLKLGGDATNPATTAATVSATPTTTANTSATLTAATHSSNNGSIDTSSSHDIVFISEGHTRPKPQPTSKSLSAAVPPQAPTPQQQRTAGRDVATEFSNALEQYTQLARSHMPHDALEQR